MEIYVVKPGDDIYTIANKYKISVSKLIQDNEIENPNNLVIGQTIVIVFPKQMHTVQAGDTLNNIAEAYGVSLIQLLQCNPYLSGRKYIFPGEVITISYNTSRAITTHGYTYPYIKRETLLKTLSNLTYLSIFNYRATEEGEIIPFEDDTVIIQLSRSYGVIPLMMTSTFNTAGEQNIETAFNILINNEYQETHINAMLDILENKGFAGVNMTFNYLNNTTQPLYENFVRKVSERIKREGYLYFVTINPNITNTENNKAVFDKVDYTGISQYVDGIVFLQFIWGTNYGPPAPVSSINNIRQFTDFVVTEVSSNKIILGKPIIGYDWQLPYLSGKSAAHSLSINASISLTNDTGSTIMFDEITQTPYFNYYRLNIGAPDQHIVWFIDARSIEALDKLITEYELSGIGVWNIMVYYAQLWLILRSQFEIVKLLPENLDVI